MNLSSDRGSQFVTIGSPDGRSLKVWTRVLLGLCLCGSGVGIGGPGMAQISPDSTLGAESSRVVATPLSEVVEGGALRGSNLFHSFREFNVNAGQRVYFANPVGVQSIFGRVTGGTVSNILGTLGVSGGANLFLLNPQGFLFGPNATLDIRGSFLATTGDRFLFPDNQTFGVDTPTAPLLTVSVPSGVQYGGTPATIRSQGNLAVGQDLTLAAGNLNVEGTVQAGGNLTLQAQDTVTIRDSATRPMVASAGGALRVEGAQTVDIFALNHPGSGFFSGGDLVLRSAKDAIGDAHFWSGGNFRIEQMDGRVGNLLSPNDPIILASGDVTLAGYRGASLHILAGGRVILTGDVTVDGVGALDNTINPQNSNLFLASLSKVTLSNGQILEIDGSKQATLDVRAGVDWSKLGGFPPLVTPPITDPYNPSSVPNLTSTKPASSASIDVKGTIKIDTPSGLIFLTNLYQPNPVFSPDQSKITVIGALRSDLDSQFFSTLSPTDNAGRIMVESNGEITIGQTNNPSGGAINASIMERGTGRNAGSAGSVQLTSLNSDITVQGGIFTNVTSVSGRASGSSGDIRLQARQGTIKVTANASGAIVTRTKTDTLNPSSSDTTGDAGTITIDARTITLDKNGRNNATDFDITTESKLTGSSGDIILISQTPLNLTGLTIGTDARNGQSGDVQITAPSLVVDGTQISTKTQGSGQAGNIAIISPIGDVSLKNGTFLKSSSEALATGNGGAIRIAAGTLALDSTSFVDASSFGRGNSGNIDIIVSGTTTLSGSGSRISNSVSSSATGNGGFLRIKTGSLLMSGRAQINSTMSGIGDAGDIEITVAGETRLNNSTLTNSVSGTSNGGLLKLNSGSLFMDGRATIRSVMSGTGNAGDINVNVAGKTNLNNSTLTNSVEGKGDGGRLILNSGSLFMSGTRLESVMKGIGNAGDINVNVAGETRLNNSTLNNSVSGTGNGGRLALNSSSLFMSGARLESAMSGTGNAGDIDVSVAGETRIDSGSRLNNSVERGSIGNGGLLTLSSGNLFIGRGARLESIMSGTGNAGDINVNVAGETRLDNSTLTNTVSGTGNGGRLALNSGNLFMSRGARLESIMSGTGNAGDINVNVAGETRLDNSTLNNSVSGIGNGGRLQLNSGSLFMSGARLESAMSGTGNAGDIGVNVAGETRLDNSTLNNSVSGIGNGGRLQLNSGSLFMSSSARLESAMSGRRGDAGDINVNVAGETRLDNSTLNNSVGSSATGNGGLLTLNSGSLSVRNGAQLQSVMSGQGNAGGIAIAVTNTTLIDGPNTLLSNAVGENSTGNGGLFTLRSGNLSITNGAKIDSSMNGKGDVGDIAIAVTGNTLIDRSSITNAIQSKATGSGGEITLTSGGLTISNGATLTATSSGKGNAGAIRLSASQDVLLQQAQISSDVQPGGVGNGGNVAIAARALTLRDSAVEARSQGQGNAGNVNIRAQDTILLQNSQILSTVDPTGIGRGGNVTLTAPKIVIADQSSLKVDNRSTSNSGTSGIAGDIRINSDFLKLNNNASITAETQFGDGGNIFITANDMLLLRRNSFISTSAGTEQRGGNGGQISITAPKGFVIAVPWENSDIIANAFGGKGGKISLSANRIFGLTQRSRLSPAQLREIRNNGTSDISASSNVGADGSIAISVLQIDPAEGLADIHTDLVDPSGLISQSCQPGRDAVANRGEYVVTGRGGLPLTPEDAMSSTDSTVAWVSHPGATGTTTPSASAIPVQPLATDQPLVEAQGIAIAADGTAFLTAQASTAASHPANFAQGGCARSPH